MKNYTQIETKFIEDIKTKVTVYRHDKTGARVMTLENDDANKVFTIAFRTPAINSCGLTHILEHSVLCGSEKYPVKDPFLELIKSSLNTFLNAFTAPDRTMYPCASENDKDFKNLMSVYCDAVFFPNVLKNENFFRQEGWRYELFNKEDPIIYNGVVYNEMKGAFSSPDSVLSRQVMHNLFPDNCYQFESGGDPDVIPDLSYEEFCAFHKKFYVPSNAFIYLYGNCDMEERLAWLDENYLSRFEKIDFDTTVKAQKPFGGLRRAEGFYPIGKEGKEEHKTSIDLCIAYPHEMDRLEKIAINLLNRVLIQLPDSPLRQALLNSGICDSVDGGFDTSLYQPNVEILIKNSDPEKADKFLEIYKEVILEQAGGKLNRALISSYIDNLEFRMRENRSNPFFPQGLDYILTSISTWMYDEDKPYEELENLFLFPKIRKALEEGFFEKVLKERFLDFNHALLYISKPSKTMLEEKEAALKEKLAKYKASLNEKQIEELIKKSEELRVFQATPSTPEQIATLPRLAKEDLVINPKNYTSEKLDGEPFDLYKEVVPSNGIAYSRWHFNLGEVPNEYLPYVKLLSSLYTYLPTKNFTPSEISAKGLSLAGFLTFNFSVSKAADESLKFLFTISAPALYKNVEGVKDLIHEIIANTVFDENKIREFLAMSTADLVSTTVRSGHMLAFRRALSHVDALGYINDSTGGIGYQDFLVDLSKNFDAKKEEIIEKLGKARDFIFSKAHFLFEYAGEESEYAHSLKVAESFYESLPEGKALEGKFVFAPNPKNEAIRAPFDIDFVARAGRLKEHGGAYGGPLLVLNNCLTNDYLWMKVRVKGGAYGVFMANSRDGELGYASYRDPKLAETDDVFKAVPDFIDELDLSEDDLLKCKIGAFAGLGPTLHPCDQGSRGFNSLFLGFPYESIVQTMTQVVNCSLEELKAYRQPIADALKDSVLVVFGSGKLIEENKDKFDVIRDIAH